MHHLSIIPASVKLNSYSVDFPIGKVYVKMLALSLCNYHNIRHVAI